MGIRQFKPVTKGTRFRSVSDFAEITRARRRSRCSSRRRAGGRDNHGHISSRTGGGHKRKYRIIDFKRNKLGVSGTVTEIEYDPNRSARIALVKYADGEKRYILHPKGLSVGATIVCGPGSDPRRATRCRSRRCRSAPRCTTSSSRSARAARWRACRRRCPGGGEGRRLRHAPPAVDRDASGARPLPGDDRRSRQRRARADVEGQGRQEPLAGQAPEGAR